MVEYLSTVVIDATLLNHSARADNLDLLGEYLKGYSCWTTSVVVAELQAGYSVQPKLRCIEDASWLECDRLDSIEGISCYSKWLRRVGSQPGRNQGEASIFASAELKNGMAITDDRESMAVARSYSLPAHGTLWLLNKLWNDGVINYAEASSFIDALRAHGARLPCGGSDFYAWCVERNLPVSPTN